MVKFATFPAVAEESPLPNAVDTAALLSDGTTVMEKGDPEMCCLRTPSVRVRMSTDKSFATNPRVSSLSSSTLPSSGLNVTNHARLMFALSAGGTTDTVTEAKAGPMAEIDAVRLDSVDATFKASDLFPIASIAKVPRIAVEAEMLKYCTSCTAGLSTETEYCPRTVGVKDTA